MDEKVFLTPEGDPVRLPAQGDSSQIAALFEAPHNPGGEVAEYVALADPLQELDPEQADADRLRQMKVDAIIAEYLGTRDLLDEERHKYQAFEKNMKDKLERMSMILREKADVLGVDNFNVRGLATAYRSEKTSYRVGDWEAFSNWIIETKNTQCLEKRVAKLATVEVERALGQVPPGVDKQTEVEFLVRRAK